MGQDGMQTSGSNSPVRAGESCGEGMSHDMLDYRQYRVEKWEIARSRSCDTKPCRHIATANNVSKAVAGLEIDEI
jgi:hypothetical protein